MADSDVWPEWMPRPQQEGFSIQPVDTRLTSEMEIGSVVRVEFNTDMQIASCTLALDRLEAAWFEAFEQTLQNQGAKWFRFPLWISGEIQYRLVRMRERPKLNRTSGLTSWYALSLDVADRELMSRDLTEALLHYSPDEIVDMANRLHPILHVQAPGLSLVPADFWPLSGVEYPAA